MVFDGCGGQGFSSDCSSSFCSYGVLVNSGKVQCFFMNKQGVYDTCYVWLCIATHFLIGLQSKRELDLRNYFLFNVSLW